MTNLRVGALGASFDLRNNAREIYQRVMADFRMRRHVTQAA